MRTVAAPGVPGPPRGVLPVGPVGRRRRRAGTLTVATVLAAVVATVEVLYRHPPVPFDQINYVDAARDFPSHSPYVSTHQLLRHGLTLPIRLAQEVFGYSQAAYLAVPMVAGVGLALGVFALGTLLFSRTVGVAAALLTVGNTVVFPTLTMPLPDLPATALLCWAAVLAVAVRQRRELVTARRWRERVTLLAVGGLLGWSYLVREYMVLLWPVVVLMLVRRIPLRRLTWVLAAVATVVGAETALNAVAYDDPLARLRVSMAHGSGPPLGNEPWRVAHLGQEPAWYLTRVVDLLGSTPEGAVLVLCLAATVVGGLCSRRVAFLLVWALSFYVPLVLLGGLLDADHPKLRINVARYWLPLVPAVALAAVGSLWLLVRRLTRSAWRHRRPVLAHRLATLVVVLAVAWPVGVAHHARATGVTDPYRRYAANGATELETFRGWFLRHRDQIDQVWAPSNSLRMIKVFLTPTFGGPRWTGTLTVLRTLDQPAAGDHVVFYSARSETCGSCLAEARELLGDPVTVPDEWRLVFQAHDRRVEVYEVR